MQNNSPNVTYLQDYMVPSYLIETVSLEFQLAEQATLVKSSLTMQRNNACANKGHDLKLVGEQLVLKSIHLNHKLLDVMHYRVDETSLTIFSVPDNFTLDIVTEINPQKNTELQGLYLSSGNFCTQCEAEGFRRITYFLDRPDVMARYKVKMIADKTKYPLLLSNGNPRASGELPDNKHWVEWEDPFKKPSYLFALVAGNLECLEDDFVTKSGKKVSLKIYVEKGCLDKSHHAMQAVKKAMRWDEEKFGREYDLDIYMIVAVSDFNMGAMENKGLNIFNTKYVLAKPETATDEDYINIESVIAHEYFHNWTGNRITCRDWFQLSLKEGLTVFRDQSFTADTTSKTVARIRDVNDLRNSQFSEDAGPLSHPVRPESYIEINNFYTATVYEKGAEVIRMIQTILGEELFRKGMDLYFSRYDGQAVTIEDFVKAMENASGIDLAQFRLWYSQAGTPHIEVEDDYDSERQLYRLRLKQSCHSVANQFPAKPFHIPIKIGLIDDEGNEVHQSTLHLKKNDQSFEFENIQSCPTVSLLRDFSAPVKISYDYADSALALLMRSDTNLFNRWEAGQRYALDILQRLIKQYQQNEKFILDEGYLLALKDCINQLNIDKLFLAEMLQLPSERYIAEQMEVVDTDAIHHARDYLLMQVALMLKDTFLKIYAENNLDNQTYSYDFEKIGRRRLRNTAMFYLSLLPEKKQQETVYNHFSCALDNNMTDTIAALRCLTQLDMPEREMALELFYKKWRNDPLIVDKWLSIQAESALPTTLSRINALLKHPAFDLKNPNKVYALIGAFTMRNPVRFHEKDGSGYAWLGNLIRELDVINPTVSARMVKPLTDWRRYDAGRQKLMCAQLEEILKNKKLSKDVFELVSKSLKNNA